MRRISRAMQLMQCPPIRNLTLRLLVVASRTSIWRRRALYDRMIRVMIGWLSQYVYRFAHSRFDNFPAGQLHNGSGGRCQQFGREFIFSRIWSLVQLS
jgi:hypothetical protein